MKNSCAARNHVLLVVVVIVCIGSVFAYAEWRRRLALETVRVNGGEVDAWSKRWFRGRLPKSLTFNASFQDTQGLGRVLPSFPLEDLSIYDVENWDPSLIGAIASIRGLKRLTLHGCHLVDADIRTLSRQGELESLYVLDANLTRESLAYFSQFGALKKLILSNSGLELDDLLQLRRQLPDCQVVFNE